MTARRKHEDQALLSQLASDAAGVSKTVDESGATQPYVFTVTSRAGLFDITAVAQTDHTSTTFNGITDLTVIGSIFDDAFKVDLASLAAGASIYLDGEAGTDSLDANFQTVSAKFLVNTDGTVDSDVGTFANFEKYALTFTGGTSTVRTGAGADTFTLTGGTVTIDAGSGDDVFNTTQAGEYHLDGGAGKDIWNARILSDKGRGILDVHDGVLTLNDTSTVTDIGSAILSIGGPFEVRIDGAFTGDPLDISLRDGRSINAYVNFSQGMTGAQVGVRGTVGHDYYSDNFGFYTDLGSQFTMGASRATGLTAIGTAFDDDFYFDFVPNYGDLTVSFDGGAGTDFLYLDTVGDPYYYFDDVPSARFIVGEDGSIQSNIFEFKNFEQFDILTDENGYVVTGALDDTITGGGVFFGKGGNDTLKGTYDGALLIGGVGDDMLIGNGKSLAGYLDATGGVTVSVADGVQDTRGAGIDTLSGIVGLVGSAYDDVLTGDGRDNTLDGAGGDDTLIGAGGIDTASYGYAASGVTVSLAVATAQDTVGAGRDTLSGFENLTGSAFNDVLAGDAGDNVLNGGDGDDKASFAAATSGVTIDLRVPGPQASGAGVGADTLVSIEGVIGSNFDDVINGDFRDNVIEGGGGNDTLDGTTGFDVVSYAGATAGVTVDLRLTTAQDTGGAGTDTIANFEGITGSDFADTLIADGGNNRLIGAGGDDRLTGGNGSDELRGGDGVDTAIYQVGTWSNYAVTAGKGGSFTVTNLAKGDVDTLYSVEKVQFGDQTFAIGDLVNAAPRARADKVGGVIEAGSDQPGQDTAAGNVLANDRDANLATPRLGEMLKVTGIASGRGGDELTAVGNERTVEGRFGTLTIHADGTFDYRLDNDRAVTEALRAGKTGRDVFTYEIADAHGATSSATLTVAVQGSKDAASLDGSAFETASAHATTHDAFHFGAHATAPIDLPLA